MLDIYYIVCYEDNYNNGENNFLHKKDSKVGELKKNIATYGFIEGEMASKS